MLFESSTSEGAELGKRPASTALENGGKKRASGQMEQTHDIITVVVKSQVIYLFLVCLLMRIGDLVTLVLVFLQVVNRFITD